MRARLAFNGFISFHSKKMKNSAVTKIPTFLCSRSTMEAHYFDVSIDNFEQVNADLVINTSIRK